MIHPEFDMISLLFVDNSQNQKFFESVFVLMKRAIPHKTGTKTNTWMTVHCNEATSNYCSEHKTKENKQQTKQQQQKLKISKLNE